jgi:hypothetical protein
MHPGEMQLLDTDVCPDDFLVDDPLGGDFYRVAGCDAIPGFQFGYLVASRVGVRVAVVPYFVTKFAFNTMLDEGWVKRALGDFGLRIACIGHPCAPFGRIDGETTPELIEQVFAILKTRAPIVAMKGFGPDLALPDFVRVAGMPVAILQVRDDFWQALKSHRRNDFRRKLKFASKVRFDEVEGLPAQHLEQVYRLYLNTYGKANVRFERLSLSYFEATADLSRYLLAFLNEQLVGFFQLIRKGRTMVVFYIGLDYKVATEHAVYFALNLKAVDIAIANGCDKIEFGETNYTFKKNMGCDLIDTWLYYLHRNPFANWLLARFSFLLAPSEKELR